MNTARQELIRERLEAAFSPAELLVKDQSKLHEGHAGAQGGGHFEVRIVADAFAAQSRIQRHQAVYAALGDLLQSDVHALRIKALAPDEL